MPDPYYIAPPGLQTRDTCRPTRWQECNEPYMPERPRASPAASSGQRSAAVLSSQMLPVIMTGSLSGGVSSYIDSSLLSFDFILRGLYFSVNGLTNSATSDLRAAIRTTANPNGNITAWNNGQQLFSAYSEEENITVNGQLVLAPLWVPINGGGRRLITRWQGDNTNDLSVTVIAVITPASDLDAQFGVSPPADPLGNGSGIDGCARSYRPPIQGPDGLLYPGDPICLDDLPDQSNPIRF